MTEGTIPIEADIASLEWLKDFITELNTQDNRITATPYYFTIQCRTKVYGVSEEAADDYDWIDNDGDSINAQEYVFDSLLELQPDDRNTMFQTAGIKDSVVHKEDVTDAVICALASDVGITKAWYRKDMKHKGFFFTEKAGLQHLKENAHHYPKDATLFLDHLWRNPEIKNLLESIGKIVGVPYERK